MNYKVIFAQDRLGKVQNKVTMALEKNATLASTLNFLAYFVMDETSTYVDTATGFEFLSELNGDDINEIAVAFKKAKDELVPFQTGKQ